MSQLIAFTCPVEGRVKILSPSPNMPIEEVLQKDVPAAAQGVIVDRDALPSDNRFFRAWRLRGKEVHVDLEEARTIAHQVRRKLRDLELAPHDNVIAKRIPGWEAAEEHRQAIREKYARVQLSIDSAPDPDALSSVLSSVGMPEGYQGSAVSA